MEDLCKMLEKLLTELGAENRTPCSRRKMMDVDGPNKLKRSVACVGQYEDETDEDGRPVFYYGNDCAVVSKLCPACAAYWHVAVARNCLLDVQRTERFRHFEAERTEPSALESSPDAAAEHDIDAQMARTAQKGE